MCICALHRITCLCIVIRNRSVSERPRYNVTSPHLKIVTYVHNNVHNNQHCIQTYKVNISHKHRLSYYDILSDILSHIFIIHVTPRIVHIHDSTTLIVTKHIVPNEIIVTFDLHWYFMVPCVTQHDISQHLRFNFKIINFEEQVTRSYTISAKCSDYFCLAIGKPPSTTLVYIHPLYISVIRSFNCTIKALGLVLSKCLIYNNITFCNIRYL